VVLLVLCTGFGTIDQMETVIEKVQTSGFTGGFADGGVVITFLIAQVLIMGLMILVSVIKPFRAKA